MHQWEVKVWSNSRIKIAFYVVAVLQFIYVLACSLISWQATELYGSESIISKGIGRGYVLTYLIYSFSVLAVLVGYIRIGVMASFGSAILLFIWALKYAKVSVVVALGMQVFLVPVTLLLLFLSLRYKNA